MTMEQKIMHELTFLPLGKKFLAKDGMTLLEAQIQAGLKPDAPCGGKGTCGKCLVDVHTGQGLERVKACKTLVDKDMTITLLHTGQTSEILTLGSGSEDWPPVDPLPIPGLKPGLLAACDLGSTSIVVYLLNSKDGALLATASALNPQTSFSADVIGRIDYAKKNGPKALTTSVRATIQELLQSACQKAKALPEQITHLCLVGNCCMHHLFFGISTDSLAVIPYSPAVTDAMVVSASEYGISIHPQGVIQALPNMAGFVGADTVGCLSAARFDQQTDMTLLLDIGTNGELVLGTKDRRLTCSTAAGPALEGAKISCGMRGATGAIDHVWIQEGTISYSVIGRDSDPTLSPCGVCGSGLIDAISVFLNLGILDETGRFTEEENWPDPSACIQLEKMKAYAFTDGVSITQKDVREVQLAKAAIAAGIQLMCEQLDITASQIQQVLIAGAFGNYMNPESACRIGLIPSVLKNRILPMGNGAGTGARLCVGNQGEFERAKKMAAETEFLELASLEEFQDTFVDELGFEA
ncbi:MAG: DUF4445 domain-containing protein [Lachnospiraceae bacterium]|nr:DUF4445 domain-containing protein [Lachnospiraceae bacterium]MCI9133163.1 DUF4445 domain-containing protein [Lachnospiraceae bacterium]